MTECSLVCWLLFILIQLGGGGIGGEERWECPSVISEEHYKIAQGLPAAEWADESVLGCDLITAAVEVVRWGEVIASDNIY